MSAVEVMCFCLKKDQLMGIHYAIYNWDSSCFFNFHKFWSPTLYSVGALVAIANEIVVQYVW